MAARGGGAVAAEELKDRTDRLFGRVADVEHLLVRAQLTGLTAVVAPPLMGKSWLLAEVARRLATGAPQPFLVGYSRSPRGGRDRLLRVVSDLYQRWLGEARAWEQARMTWEQQKEGLLSRLAASVTKVAGKAAKTLGGEVVATAIEEAMGGLIAASDRLNNVGFAPPLDYDRALELVRGVHMVAKRRMALVLDQWEESPDLGAQIQVLRDFLRDREDWPPCHFFLGVREGTDGAAMVEELLRDHGAPSDTYPLGDMELDDAETRRLLDRLRAPLPGIWDVDDAAVVDLTGGYPGVVAFWLDENNAGRIGTLDGLRQLAQEARARQYRALEKLLLDLRGDARRLAVRIALVPLAEDTEGWRDLRPTLLDGINPEALDELREARILVDAASVPGLGHPTRREAALDCLRSKRAETVRAEADGVALSLARQVSDAYEGEIRVVAALKELPTTAGPETMGRLPRAVCQAAAMLFGESPGDLIEAAGRARATDEIGVAPMLALGLFNTLLYAMVEGDLARRDALLNELRRLAVQWPEDQAVRKQLAMGLAMGLVNMAALAQEELAKGLVNTAAYAQEEGDLARRDALLDELHRLAARWPGDQTVRKSLAMGLVNTAAYAQEESDLARRDALLDELRRLAARLPDDQAVRENLAHGLFNTLNDAKAGGDLARRDALLDELRRLAVRWPDDQAVRENLANGLFNTLKDAKAEGDLARRDALLDELRRLVARWPEDQAVRKSLAMGLFNTLNDAKAEGDLARRDALLDEMRRLASQWPEDQAVREQMADGLANTAAYTQGEGDRAQRDALLDELRDLAVKWPTKTEVCGALAEGILVVLIDAKAQGDAARCVALLNELRDITAKWPEDRAIREWLAKELVDTLFGAREADRPARWGQLFKDLRSLAAKSPNDPVLYEVTRILDEAGM